MGKTQQIQEEQKEFEDGSDSIVGEKYEGEEETPKKKKPQIAPLPTKPTSDIPPILRFELDFSYLQRR